MAVLLYALFAAHGHAAETKVARQLTESATVTWQDVPLATALSRLADSQSLSIWLDRRIDPSAPITLAAVDRPLNEIFATLGQQTGAAITPFAGVVYFGPQQTVDELATLAAIAREPLSRAPADVRGRWLKSQPCSFARLREPRELLNELAASVGAKMQQDQFVPHDLWPARDLPAMAPIDRAVLMLAGFDLTCEIVEDGNALLVAPIARPVVIAEEYRVPNSRRSAFDAALAELPGATQTGEGSRQAIAARVEDHERLRAALAGRKTGAVAAAEAMRSASAKLAGNTLDDQRFTLTIANKPLVPVLNQLASQLQLQLQWDATIPEADAARSTLVSCQVEKANLDKLLKALLEPAALTFERQENRVTIRRR